MTILGIDSVENNNWLTAVATLMTIVGSKYILLEFDDECENLLRSTFMRRMIVFFILFNSSKDIVISLVLTLVYIMFSKAYNGHKKAKCNKKNVSKK